ncbi:MAG: 2-hydroxycyclohexanecarboxyl-CoA dehydrogenase [Betaproteobacteria bacterium RIFCSPLOWO2_02_FULL_65_24]|nr:MAG: 2-hydroxycyclohexanecarboxyl-CoA dehydrogenase [Betaproteobacteria bacterium RIFCSPLOWO2_02_FULL_65_24]OGA96065.1 MAG: 2-hydroxycyclohexanecarboxyl-CoA dehydrogenase [Betaproteobacteria bacterium RIFCSPLOWO2_12_FULL_66_14]
MTLEGKTAVVTGAASGIGKATAFQLARAGARVILADINEQGGAAAEGEAKAAGLKAEFLRLDITDPASIEQFGERALQKGRVDILVNGAGWGKTEAFVQNSPEFWDKVMNINLMGPIRLTRRLLPPMFEAGYGKIVNVASDAGRVGSLGETVYSAAKGGLIAFTKGLAREGARYNVTVNCVCPGPTDTPLFQAVPEKFKEAFVRAIPFRRLGKPEEVAAAIVFFATPASDYVTGQVLSVSGGLTMAG